MNLDPTDLLTHETSYKRAAGRFIATGTMEAAFDWVQSEIARGTSPADILAAITAIYGGVLFAIIDNLERAELVKDRPNLEQGLASLFLNSIRLGK